MTKRLKIKSIFPLSFLISLFLLSCAPSEDSKKLPNPRTGKWLMNMQLKGVVLPFSFELNEQEGEYNILIRNAEERISIDGVRVFKDSIQFKMPVFESEFFLKVHTADSLSGQWINYYKSDDYIIDVWATAREGSRFKGFSQTNKIPYKLHSKYEVEFSPNEEGAYKAIGLFEQDGDWVKGTFATETGDYRYLEGRVIGDSLFLSTFDGSHAFYFSAGIKDSTLKGVFISGIHHRENWVARQNSDFELRDPDSLTSLTDSSAISFSLPNANGDVLSLSDSSFENKVKIILIMGSWCPNCLDESRYFNSLYHKYAEKGLEIIALAFERTRSEERAFGNLQRLESKENLSYPILLAGYNRDQHPRKIFPMLDKIMSYPTTLYLDKENKVRKIHTGFYGPGTGEYYDAFKEETESFIEELLAED